jgi:hypothetical protein
MAIKLHDSFAVHPGAWLRSEIVEPAGLNVTAIAGCLHVTRQAASNLLNGSAGVSAENGEPLREGVRGEPDPLLRSGSRLRLRWRCNSVRGPYVFVLSEVI